MAGTRPVGPRGAVPSAVLAAARLPLVLALLGASLLAGGTEARPARAVPIDGEPIGGPRMGELGLVVDLPAGAPAPPALPAGGYVLADAVTGEVLLAKAPHAKGLPASTMKALTAVALVPRMDPRTLVRAMPEDAAVDGTRVGLDPGATYTVGQLFGSLLLASANDSAVAIARSYGGPREATTAMNATARTLGAHDTTARNTSGLDAPGQMTSAYDLALIGRAALRDDDVAAYVEARTVRFPGGRPATRGQRRAVWDVSNHNKLIWNYDGAVGVKNGYTTRARQTFIGAAHRGDRTYLVTFLNGATADWRPTAALLDWAFAHGDRARAVGRLVEPRTPGTSTPPATAAAAAGFPGPGDGRTAMGRAVGVGVERPWVAAALAAALVAAGAALAAPRRR